MYRIIEYLHILVTCMRVWKAMYTNDKYNTKYGIPLNIFRAKPNVVQEFAEYIFRIRQFKIRNKN